jgi:hypothetical protein
MTWRAWLLMVAVLLLATLLLVRWMPNSLFFRAAPASRLAGLPTEERRVSVAYQVFEPVIVPYHRVVDFFRPANLKQTGCSWTQRLALPLLLGWLEGCVTES